MKTTIVPLLWTFALTCGVTAADMPFGIWCTVDGKDAQFLDGARAVSTAGGGLSLTAHNFRMWMKIEVPNARTGKQRLAETPGLKLSYEDVLSSSTRDHYTARSTNSDTELEVTLTRFTAGDDVIEGEFSAQVSNGPAKVRINSGELILKGDSAYRTLRLTKGKFRLRRSNDIVGTELNRAQPPHASNSAIQPGR